MASSWWLASDWLWENQRTAKTSLGWAVALLLPYVSIFPIPSKLISIRKQPPPFFVCFVLLCVVFTATSAMDVLRLLLCARCLLSTFCVIISFNLYSEQSTVIIGGMPSNLWARRPSRNILVIFIPGEELRRANCHYFYIDPDEQARAVYKRNPQPFYCCLNRKSIGILISTVLCGVRVSLT